MLSEYLKKQRLKRCLTQDEVAEAVGITKPYYCQLETGKKTPGIKTIQKLANFYNIKPAKLMKISIEEVD